MLEFIPGDVVGGGRGMESATDRSLVCFRALGPFNHANLEVLITVMLISLNCGENISKKMHIWIYASVP